MKKTKMSGKIVRHLVTYLVCLVLAVFTWVLVMYTEHEEQANTESNLQAVLLTEELSADTI